MFVSHLVEETPFLVGEGIQLDIGQSLAISELSLAKHSVGKIGKIPTIHIVNDKGGSIDFLAVQKDAAC